jgi:hypothetical protein
MPMPVSDTTRRVLFPSLPARTVIEPPGGVYFHGVGEQIDERLAQLVPVGGYEDPFLRPDFERHSLAKAERLEGPCRRAGGFGEIKPFRGEGEDVSFEIAQPLEVPG